MGRNFSQERAAELLLLFVAVTWAANYPLAKYALTQMNPFVFNAIRFIVASLTVFALFLLRSEWRPVDRKDWPMILRAGVVGNVIYQVAFIIGLSLTTAGNSAVLLSTSPLWTVFINSRMHGEKIRPAVLTGMSLSLVGVFLIIAGSSKKLSLGGYELIGDIIILCAAVLWALNTNLQKPLLFRYSPVQLALVMLATGAAGLALIAIPPAVRFNWGSAPPSAYFAAVLSGAVSIGIGNAIWSRGVKRLGPGRTANFNNLVPVLALLISYFTINEELMLIQMVGAGVTIVGVWLARG